ncbi:MAG: DUF4055 domain-containing protein [Sneathiella sp.]
MTDPSKPSDHYKQMSERWALPLTLMGGSPAMHEAGSRFLPRHPAETEKVYQDRARRTVLRNYFRRAVKKTVGRVFSSPLKPSDDMPSPLLTILRNVDLAGRGLNSFAQSWFEDALVCGLSHVLIDFPVSDTSGSTGLFRPYAVHISAQQLIATQWEMTAEGHRLTQIRIQEEVTECDGFEERKVRQIRVMSPHNWQLYRLGARGEWLLADEGTNSLGEIPLVTLYTNRVGFQQACPPFEDLAYLNLEHYQIRSDQRNALNVASFPILAASGYDTEIDGRIEVGPNKVLTTSDTGGKYYYVESTGAALEAGARELSALEKAIHLFGLQFEAGEIRETATGRALDAADAVTPLSHMVTNLEDSLNKALHFMGRWIGTETVGAISVQTDQLSPLKGHQGLDELMALQEKGLIDAETLLSELARRGVLKESLAFNGTPD